MKSRNAPRTLSVLAAAVAALIVAGCAAPQLDAQWVDPQAGANPLRGARVLVACEAYEPVVKRVCQDRLAEELTARGASPIVAPDMSNPSPGRPLPDEQYVRAARAAGAKGVLVATVSLAAGDYGYSPGFTIGLGGFGIGGGHSGVGVGVSAPIGGGRPTSSYAANARLTDSASGRLLWTAKASAAPSNDLEAQLAQLARTIVAAGEKSNLF